MSGAASGMSGPISGAALKKKKYTPEKKKLGQSVRGWISRSKNKGK